MGQYIGDCMQYMGKGKVEMKLTNLKVIIIQCYHFAYFWGNLKSSQWRPCEACM